jgi:hypothetical protein
LIGECVHPRAVVPGDPAVGDGVDRLRVDVVQLLPAPPHGGDEVRGLEQREVLADRLPGHIQVGAQLTQRLPVAGVEPVEQVTPAGVGERLEHVIVVRHSSRIGD